MPAIAVCSLALLDDHITRLKPAGVVSLLSPGSMIETPAGIGAHQHLRLEMHDITEAADGHTHPGEAHARTLLDFVSGWDQAAPLLIHCWAGVSRSTASAFITACAVNPAVAPEQIARRMRTLSPTATPNRLLVAHADRLLDRGGAMLAAIDDIGRGADCWEGVPFALPAAWDRPGQDS
jgi:predicted protein tyrosine phosphatase